MSCQNVKARAVTQTALIPMTLAVILADLARKLLSSEVTREASLSDRQMVTPSSRAYDGFACGDAMITTLLESVEIHGVVILVVDDLTSPYDIPSVFVG